MILTVIANWVLLGPTDFWFSPDFDRSIQPAGNAKPSIELDLVGAP